MEAVDPLVVAKQIFSDQPPGFPFEGFDLEELILPDGDDFGIGSDDDQLDGEEVETETGFGSIVVVDNLPVVEPEKYDKLMSILTTRIFNQIATIKDVYMPKEPDTNKTKGFAFIEFATPEEAREVVRTSDGYRLDKNHVFKVTPFDAFDRYGKVPDEYQPPEPKTFAPVENLHSWMVDKVGRDQFVIRYGDDTAVLWNDGRRARCEEVYKRTFWTETFVQWSPQGNLLATMHRQGVAVWGGEKWVRMARYNHPSVQLIEFSPNEHYLLTYSSIEPSNPREKTQVLLNVFDVRSGKKLRSFERPMDQFAVGSAAGPGGSLKWPFLKWAGGRQDMFFARLYDKNHISVFSCETMDLLDAKKLKLDGVADFEWSPSEPVLSVYTTEESNRPAKISLIKIPERTELRQKNLFSVSDVNMFWHPQGDYLAVQVDHFTKSKKSTTTGFELFSIREKDIPMEVLELPNKNDKITAFAWEPKGHRFAIVHSPEGGRPNVSFYSMKDDKGRLGVKLLGTLPAKAVNHIHWSPQGHNIVLAGLKNLNGQLEFFNVDEFEVMAAAEHFMCTDVEWDPTGRYVATAVTAINQMENGFNIWSFNGKLLYTLQRDRFFQFSWRPRMPSLLTPEKEAEIAKNLKQYSKKYDEEDEALVMQADADVLQERQKMADEWQAWMESTQEYVEELAAFKRKVYGSKADEPEYTMSSKTVEQVLDVKEEPYTP